jgi:hypothetical protein
MIVFSKENKNVTMTAVGENYQQAKKSFDAEVKK